MAIGSDFRCLWEGLAQTFRAAVHNGSHICVKHNTLHGLSIRKQLLRSAGTRWVHDFVIFTHLYLEPRANALGLPQCRPAPTGYCRAAPRRRPFRRSRHWTPTQGSPQVVVN